MQFRITYSEISELIKSKAKKDLPLCYGGTHTVRISYKMPLMPAVGIDINVDRVFGSDLFLSFSGGAGIEYMLRTALNQAKGSMETDSLELLGGNQMVVHLGKRPDMAALFERIDFQDVSFDEQYVIIDFQPRDI